MTPLIVALLLLYVGSAASSTVRIDAGAPNGTLLNALVNPAVTDVVFEADYHIDDEFEAYAGVKPELQLTRQVHHHPPQLLTAHRWLSTASQYVPSPAYMCIMGTMVCSRVQA